MVSPEQKLDSVVTAIERIVTKLDAMDTKFDRLDKRLNVLETKLEQKCDQLEKAANYKFDKIEVRLNALEKAKSESETAALMQESYNKRFNILLHGIEEDKDSAWEAPKATEVKFDSFLKNALKIERSTIQIIDIHRLPQHPVIKNGEKLIRPTV